MQFPGSAGGGRGEPTFAPLSRMDQPQEGRSAFTALLRLSPPDKSATDEALMRNCASLNDDGEPLYYHAPTTGTLQGIFEAIGKDLGEIDLSM
jgi:hypothetical protein